MSEADSTLRLPTLLGSAFVFWDGTFGPDDKSWVSVVQPQNVLNPWSTVTGNVGTAQPASTMVTGPREEWVGGPPPNTDPIIVDYIEPVPQHASDDSPYSHQMTAIDPEVPPQTLTWGDLALQSYTPFCVGCGPGANNAPTLSSGGLFEWDMVGSARGTYVWSMSVNAGAGGSDDGTLTMLINQVPEPATFSLLGLAIAMFGFIRRR